MAARRKFSREDVLTAIFQDSDSEFELEDIENGEDSESEDEEYSASDLAENSDPNTSEDDDGSNILDDQQQEQRNTTKKAKGINFDWQNYSYLDAYESNWLQDYNSRQGILVDTTDVKPVEYFSLFYPDAVFELISEETNRYAFDFFDNPVDLPTSSRYTAWYDTSPEEIKAFTALQIAMGLCQKPTLSDYWSTYWLTFTDFKKVMPRNRYELIQTFIHFNNSANQVEKGQEGYNPLFKIQPLLDICNPLYEQIYSPQKCLSIDESITKFKGRISFRQYLPAKPTKWGIKDFVLSESESGYCLKSMIYTGKCSFKRNPGQALGDQVVTELLEGYENKGHIVYMDNFYSAPFLFAKLEENNIGAFGTVKVNRKGMPEQLNPKNLKLKKGDDPVFMRSGNLVACTWHDTKRLSLLSTVDTNLTVDKRIRKKGAQGGHREMEKPVMAERYNNCMAGVDRLDQMLGSYQYGHKCCKWYHTIYHRKREVALVNSYIIYKKANEENKLCPQKFRQQVIDGQARPPREGCIAHANDWTTFSR